MYRYNELNPVRAAMVATPEQHRWASAHLGHRVDPLLTPHAVFDVLAQDTADRANADRAWLYQSIESSEVHTVREHRNQERTLGDDASTPWSKDTLRPRMQ